MPVSIGGHRASDAFFIKHCLLHSFLHSFRERAVRSTAFFCYVNIMGNNQNLKRGNAETQFVSGQMAVEAQRKSAEKRKQNNAEKKLIRERILERMNESDWDAYIDGIIQRAKESKADAEFLRDTIGQKPTEQIELSGRKQAQNRLDEMLGQLLSDES